MITMGPHLNRVLDGLTHHARSIRPVGYELLLRIAASPLDGELVSTRGGANSDVLCLNDGRRIYLHGANHQGVEVREYKHGPVKLLLKTERDARRWVWSGFAI